GELFGKKAPTNVYSPTIALDIHTVTSAKTTLPLSPHFEYGVLVLKESAIIENSIIDVNNLLYLGYGRDKLSINLPQNAHLLILGGEPFKEGVLIWWNFVARTQAEIKEATENWQT
ncbi:MAG TPA: pirin-like C-terminal cupin domain-containing protein, partial [Candidatus Berkiella sp.]|nr:pirin-like C-terminal cupin domain-containing protein [Candidatus Berkiella sp.]